MDAEENNPTEDVTLAEAELEPIGIIAEAAVPVVTEASGSVLDKDGNCTLAIIRPCMSRGRKIRGCSPVYTQEMLARNAANFKNWPMYIDHLSEAQGEAQEDVDESTKILNMILEAARKRGRSVNDIGGRIIESWYDPKFTHPDDEKYGYEPGAIMGKCRPTKSISALIEHDPDIIHVSINAFPTGVTIKNHKGTRGALIEGINPQPGSVDWVVRPGAGGRVVTAKEEAELFSVVEAAYDDNHQPQGDLTVDFATATPAEIREYLKQNRPEVLTELAEGESGTTNTTIVTEGVTEDRVLEIVTQALAEEAFNIEESAQAAASTALRNHNLTTDAHKLIEAAPLGDKAKAALKARFSPESELIEGIADEVDDEGAVTKAAADVLHETVEAEVTSVKEMIEESTGRPTGTTGGQGALNEEGEGEPAAAKSKIETDRAHAEKLVENGIYDNVEAAAEAEGLTITESEED